MENYELLANSIIKYRMIIAIQINIMTMVKNVIIYHI